VSTDYEYSSATEQTGRSNSSDVFARYQAYLQRELSACIRQELEEKLEFELDISQKIVISKAIEILESLQRKSLEEFIRIEGLSEQLQQISRQTTTPARKHQSNRDVAESSGATTVPTETLLPSLYEPKFEPDHDIWINELDLSQGLLDLPWNPDIILSGNSNSEVRNEGKVEAIKPSNWDQLPPPQNATFLWPGTVTTEENFDFTLTS
jgi:hypothetical protein